MSKKRIYNKHLEKGRFYVIIKHPGLIVFKNDRKNVYIAAVTGTSHHRHQTKLRHPTEPNVKESFVNNRPMRIVKKQEKDSKVRFRYFEIDLKDGVDVSYPEIKVMSNNKK